MIDISFPKYIHNKSLEGQEGKKAGQQEGQDG